jgi:predicted deacylase
MRTLHHPLPTQAIGTQRSLSSLHFGREHARPKVYIQASLHADELPGMLVAHHLRQHLQQAQAQGRLLGHVVLVPMANPIGLDQTVLHSQLGRFELASGQNFNRAYPDMVDWLLQAPHDITPQLGADASANATLIRQALHAALDRHPPVTELEGLRHALMRLACDADVVLDLHCDFEAAVHLYTEPPCLDVLQPLAAWLGARAVLVAQGSGGRCFDEVLSGLWWQLRQRLALRWGQAWLDTHPIPQGCASTTVELRGQADVRHDLAQTDAHALMAYLTHLGVLAGPALAVPPLRCSATPLTGTEVLTAPHPGVLAYRLAPGAEVAAGEVVADVIHPLSGHTTPIQASQGGVLYARHIVRWATTGLEIAKISGHQPLRSGYLLGA